MNSEIYYNFMPSEMDPVVVSPFQINILESRSGIPVTFKAACDSAQRSVRFHRNYSEAMGLAHLARDNLLRGFVSERIGYLMEYNKISKYSFYTKRPSTSADHMLHSSSTPRSS